MKVNVLALDIEGGHGGSSRSLYTAIQYLDTELFCVEVWCKRSGSIKESYRNIGVKCVIEPTMPKVTSLSMFFINIFVLFRFFFDFLRAREFRQRLVEAVNNRFDIVHFNHESLAWLAAWLRPRTNAGMVFHNRTMLKDSVFSQIQIKLIDKAADRLVFITENERDNMRRLGAITDGKVIYNPVEIPNQMPLIHDSLKDDQRFKICCLSNYSWSRGIDRLVDIAKILRKQGRSDVLFVVAGEINLSARIHKKLGIKGRKGLDLSDYAKLNGVFDMFLFLGHIPDPERVLAGCDLLIKPTRESNPWGRDLIEAMAIGLPVISIGTYDGFIKNNETGYLLESYDSEEVALKISNLALSPKIAQLMGKRARKIIEDKCDPFKMSSELSEVWNEVAYKRNLIEIDTS